MSRELNGPYVIGYIALHSDKKIIEKTGAYTTSYYDFDDFETENSPALSINLSISSMHRYGIPDAEINATITNKGNTATGFFIKFFGNNSFELQNFTDVLLPFSERNFSFHFKNLK